MFEKIPLNQDVAPSPAQLSKLASSAMSTANRLDKMRPVRIKERANTFCSHTDFVNIDEETDDISTNTHLMSFRVAKRVQEVCSLNGIDKYRVPIPEWNMQIFNTEWFNSDSANAVGIRSVYQFAWNRSRTHRAERKTIYVPYSVEQSSISNTLNRMQNYDIDIDLIATEDDFRRVNKDDVDDLACELNEYFESLKIR